jgi:ATP-dependent Lon protease
VKFLILPEKLLRKLLLVRVSQKQLMVTTCPDFAGIKKFKYGEIDADDQVGIVTGLAWTEVGGEILQIESVIMPGKG